MKTIREEIVPNNDDEVIGYYTVELIGCLRKMQGHRYAHADFGGFERSGNTVTYTASVLVDADGVIFHPYHSEFLDDLRRFNEGRCWYMD